MINDIAAFVRKHERHIGVAAIFLGFVWDSLTLGRPDQLFENVVLMVYLLVPAAGLLVLAIYERRGGRAPLVLLPIIQFAFGNLAGGLTVLYFKSGSLSANFVFFLLLLGFLIGNEFLRNHYARMQFHISAWYFLLISYSALIVPVLVRKVGPGVFLLSGLLSLLAVFVYLRLLYFVLKRRLGEKVRETIGKTVTAVAVIYLSFTALYFLNLIPPVPLALKSVGIYHSLDKLPNGNYRVSYERPRWNEFLRETKGTFAGGGPAYCMSSVFAPVRLSTEIYHRWERLNEGTGEWETKSLISFGIQGGRSEGYRGYSELPTLQSGRWRCSVETKAGAVIGRAAFTAVSGVVPILYGKEL
ncbi:MAG: DUF2914 domain-containing protein [bacterium]|nr:DUF2914 domain-containing protein [bacterium]